MRLARFGLSAALLLVCVGTSADNMTGRVVELLVSQDGVPPSVLRYDARNGNYKGVLGDEEFRNSDDDYTDPRGIGVDQFGRVYVAYRCTICDAPRRSKVFRFLPATGGLLLDPLDTPFVSAPGGTAGFEGLAISSDGFDLFVSQRDFGLVRHYDGRSGGLIRKFPGVGTPLGLAVDGSETLYSLRMIPSTVVENGRISRLIRFDSAFERVVGLDSGLALEAGSAGLTIGPDGNIYVVDTARDKVLKYRGDTGAFLREFVTPTNHGCLDPVAIAFGPHDQNLYLTCNASGTIVRYRGATGEFLDTFATLPTFPTRAVLEDSNDEPPAPTYLAFVSYDLPSALRLLGPPNGVVADPVSVFRWTPLDDGDLRTYRLSFARDPEMDDVVLRLPRQGGLEVDRSQTDIDLEDEGLCDSGNYYWRVAAENAVGDTIEESQETFSFNCETDQRGFTVISGLIKSNRNQIELLAGATAAVRSSGGDAEGTFSNSADTPPDGFYKLSAATRDDNAPIPGAVVVVAQKPGFISQTRPLQPQDKTGNQLEIDFLLTPVAPRDLNGDGTSDVLWRNQDTGEVAVWGVKNAAPVAVRRIGPVSPNRQVAGVGDFNGDGTSDILRRNPVSGGNAIWEMRHFVPKGWPLRPINSNWQVAGIGDFNGDGTSDIHWRNRLNGGNIIWGMSDFVPQQRALRSMVLSRQVAGVGDFNGDGTSDIFWRDPVSGGNIIWEMRDFVPKGWPLRPLNSNWQVAGIGDFNGDGTSDIHWRNRLNGGNIIWGMSDFVPQQRALRSMPLSWKVGDSADYNGDGTTDILWRNRVTGADIIWQMSNFVPTNRPFPNRPDTRWQIQR